MIALTVACLCLSQTAYSTEAEFLQAYDEKHELFFQATEDYLLIMGKVSAKSKSFDDVLDWADWHDNSTFMRDFRNLQRLDKKLMDKID